MKFLVIAAALLVMTASCVPNRSCTCTANGVPTHYDIKEKNTDVALQKCKAMAGTDTCELLIKK